MRRLFDFKCEDGHVTEQFVNNDIRESPCRQCDKPATRMIAAPRTKLDPISGDFPGETEKWANKRAKHLEYEKKAMANHGPDMAWDIARR